MLCVYGWYGGTHLRAKPCGDQSHQDRQGWSRVSSGLSFSPHEPRVCRSQFGSLQSEFVKVGENQLVANVTIFLQAINGEDAKRQNASNFKVIPVLLMSREGLRRDKETLTSICCSWKLYSSFEPISCRLWRASQSSSKWISIYLLFHHTIFSSMLLRHWNPSNESSPDISF